MPELLLEVGCEELPASFVRRAYTDLQEAIVKGLGEAGLSNASAQSLGTPRRLIVQVDGIPERQEDAQKEVRGPALAAAYGADGNPTKALEGFCRSQGVSPDSVVKEGEYVWAVKSVVGRSTVEVLAEILPAAIRSLNFDKTMRWGTSRMRFARPLRWILASFGGQPIQFEVEGIAAGLSSRGHRFNHPEPFEALSFDQLVNTLLTKQVEVDPEERKNRIKEGATVVATGDVDMTPELIDENAFLTEWPTAIEGEFKSEYLTLPEPVLVTTMAKHERFFPVRGRNGELVNRFVSIRNGGVDDVVRDGNAWVLNARFADAKFFFEEDKKHTLADFLERTEGIVFQEKLGTVRTRAERLAALAIEIAKATGADEVEQGYARQAALYCKADLSTGLVSEMTELQGLIGGEYAKREGMPEPVCHAIATHYDVSKNPTGDTAASRTALRVTIADQLDKLAGYLALGNAPSGSSDPYGLRRAATILIEIAWQWPALINGYRALASKALLQYDLENLTGENVFVQELPRLFSSRYESMLEGVRHDILDAALLDEGMEAALNPRQVKMRIKALESLADETAFIHTATRPLNIVSGADKKGLSFHKSDPVTGLDRAKLESPAGDKLADVLQKNEQPLHEAQNREDAGEVVRLLRELQAPVNEFFDSTMVMVEEEAQRHARLTLLNACCEQLRIAGDFSKLVIEGE